MSDLEQIREKWNARYSDDPAAWREPQRFLVRHRELLCPPGRALDLACGAGRNAIWLAEQGYSVDAVDASDVGIAQARAAAAAAGIEVNFTIGDVYEFPLASESYDLIVKFFFLERQLLPALKAATRPGGLLAVLTWSYRQNEREDARKINPEFVLNPDEPVSWVPGWEILADEEYVEDDKALRGTIARKPDRGLALKSNSCAGVPKVFE